LQQRVGLLAQEHQQHRRGVQLIFGPYAHEESQAADQGKEDEVELEKQVQSTGHESVQA
jgi:hypothetical protein